MGIMHVSNASLFRGGLGLLVSSSETGNFSMTGSVPLARKIEEKSPLFYPPKEPTFWLI
jgi:hypothetical protein